MVTSHSPLPALQQAIYGRLSGDAELAGLGAAVYDEVPEDAARPYVRLGEATAVPDNAHSQIGWEVTQTLHVWSDYAGHAEATGIAGRIVELLDHQPMTPAAPHVVTQVRFEFSQTLIDPAPPHPRHVPVRFRFFTAQQES